MTARQDGWPRYVPGQCGALFTGTPLQQAADLYACAEAGVDELVLSWEATELDQQIEHWRPFRQHAGGKGMNEERPGAAGW